MSLVNIQERGLLWGKRLKELVHPNPERVKPLKPIVDWQLDPNLQTILAEERVAIGSIVGAGHMPDYFSDQALAHAGLTRNNVLKVNEDQIRLLHEAKLGKVFRFIDSQEAIEKQETAIYRELSEIYTNAKNSGADRVLFSVCAISAGFDLNYSKALLRLMEENGPENFVFSIFLPFNKKGVTEYSVRGQGVNPDYWMKQWKDLQAKAENEYKGSIFIHEPTIRPVYEGEVVPEPTPDNVHARGVQVNEDQNSVYSDVNRKLVFQALLSARVDKSRRNLKKVRGVLAEAFQTSNALLGGGPEIMAMLLYAGVPLKNLDFVQDGLTETKEANEQEVRGRYRKDFLLLLDEWDRNKEITAMWGRRLRRRRFQRN